MLSVHKTKINLGLFCIIALSTFGQRDGIAQQVTDQLGKNNILIAGHRGGFDANLPENSISLFDYSVQNTCLNPIAIEFDIRESASGSLYILHDSTIDRTTNGTGSISTLSDQYLGTLFLKDRNGNMTSEKIPLFSELLSHFKNKNCTLMLDVKGNILPKAVGLVFQYNMESRCILLTFSQENTRLAKEIARNMMISALVSNQSDWNALLDIQIPSKQLIAYVSRETSSQLLKEIIDNKVVIMTDMSEGIINNSKPYTSEYYSSFTNNRQLGILITDYPVYVSGLFCY